MERVASRLTCAHCGRIGRGLAFHDEQEQISFAVRTRLCFTRECASIPAT